MGGITTVDKGKDSGNRVPDGSEKPPSKIFQLIKNPKFLILGVVGLIGLLIVIFSIISILTTPPPEAPVKDYLQINTTWNIIEYSPMEFYTFRVIEVNNIGGDNVNDLNDIYLLVDETPEYLHNFGINNRMLPIVDTGTKHFRIEEKLYLYFGTDNRFHISNKLPIVDKIADFPDGKYKLSLEDAIKRKSIGGYIATIENSTTTLVSDDTDLSVQVNDAEEHETLIIYGDLYKTHLKIDKPIRLISPYQNSTIDGGYVGAVVEIENTKNVYIRGFEIINSGTSEWIDGGIVIHGTSKYIELFDNNIHSCSYGIWLWSVDNCTVFGNELWNNAESGIYAQNGKYHNVRFNNAHHNDYGILFAEVDYSYIVENSVDYNKYYGIQILNWKKLNNICMYNDWGTDKCDCRITSSLEERNVRAELLPTPTPTQSSLTVDDTDSADFLEWWRANPNKGGLSWDEWVDEQNKEN